MRNLVAIGQSGHRPSRANQARFMNTRLNRFALVLRVAREPVEPFRLTPQQQREVRARLKKGEPRENIARGYNVDVETIKKLAKRIILARITQLRS
jgi:DNA-binding NarL/FixJ family response regulator